VPSFSPASWRADICDLGSTADYDQSGYDGYLTKVHRVRLAMAILVGMISVVMVTIAIYLCAADDDGDNVPGAVALVFVAIALVLLIIVPVYTAM
jgi:membrane protein YdbS with pleckstrin-like domain